MTVTSSPELQEAVSRQLKYYLEVKRREDGFDNSSVTQPRLQYPHYRTKSVMGGVQPLDRSLKHYFYFDPHLKTSLLNNKPKPGRIDYRKYYDYPNSRSALTNFGHSKSNRKESGDNKIEQRRSSSQSCHTGLRRPKNQNRLNEHQKNSADSSDEYEWNKTDEENFNRDSRTPRRDTTLEEDHRYHNKYETRKENKKVDSNKKGYNYRDGKSKSKSPRRSPSRRQGHSNRTHKMDKSDDKRNGNRYTYDHKVKNSEEYSIDSRGSSPEKFSGERKNENKFIRNGSYDRSSGKTSSRSSYSERIKSESRKNNRSHGEKLNSNQASQDQDDISDDSNTDTDESSSDGEQTKYWSDSTISKENEKQRKSNKENNKALRKKKKNNQISQEKALEKELRRNMKNYQFQNLRQVDVSALYELLPDPREKDVEADRKRRMKAWKKIQLQLASQQKVPFYTGNVTLRCRPSSHVPKSEQKRLISNTCKILAHIDPKQSESIEESKKREKRKKSGDNSNNKTEKSKTSEKNSKMKMERKKSEKDSQIKTNKYNYRIKVYTSDEFTRPVTAELGLILYGSKDSTEPIRLFEAERDGKVLKSNKKYVEEVKCKYIGAVERIDIGHNLNESTQEGISWLLRRVDIEDLRTGDLYPFTISQDLEINQNSNENQKEKYDNEDTTNKNPERKKTNEASESSSSDSENETTEQSSDTDSAESTQRNKSRMNRLKIKTKKNKNRVKDDGEERGSSPDSNEFANAKSFKNNENFDNDRQNNANNNANIEEEGAGSSSANESRTENIDSDSKKSDSEGSNRIKHKKTSQKHNKTRKVDFTKGSEDVKVEEKPKIESTSGENVKTKQWSRMYGSDLDSDTSSSVTDRDSEKSKSDIPLSARLDRQLSQQIKESRTKDDELDGERSENLNSEFQERKSTKEERLQNNIELQRVHNSEISNGKADHRNGLQEEFTVGEWKDFREEYLESSRKAKQNQEEANLDSLHSTTSENTTEDNVGPTDFVLDSNISTRVDRDRIQDGINDNSNNMEITGKNRSEEEVAKNDLHENLLHEIHSKNPQDTEDGINERIEKKSESSNSESSRDWDQNHQKYINNSSDENLDTNRKDLNANEDESDVKLASIQKDVSHVGAVVAVNNNDQSENKPNNDDDDDDDDTTSSDDVDDDDDLTLSDSSDSSSFSQMSTSTSLIINFHRAIEATKEGNIRLLKEIFEKSKDKQWMLRKTNSDGVTLIHVATENNKTDILEWLLSQPGANCNVTSSLGYTALHIAIINGFMDCAEILKRYNADINIKTLNGQSPLHLAASKNKIESVNWLLANGVDPEALDREGRSPIDIAKRERFSDVVQAISNWINRDLARFFN